ncbi:MAG: hypothetical protein MJA83_05630 [Gammaproteobacteria bacterium]|nr:hypothetical protein [Gammaproteobacteria bacterium]
MEGKATLTEIQTEWSIIDLLDANEALDLQEEANHLAAIAARAKGGR